MFSSAAFSLTSEFTAKERDAETGLDYFGARYYSGAQGRWTSPDANNTSQRLFIPQSWNRYTYVLNNPLGRIDPDGEKDKPFTSKDRPANWNAPGATDAFNCHSYAWYGGNGWVNDPTEKVKEATQLKPDDANQIGDRVIYYVDKNGDGNWNPGENITHSAVVTTVDSEGNTTEVTGKQGQRGIGTNHPDAPGYYKTDWPRSDDPTSRAYIRPSTPLPQPPPATPAPLPPPPKPQAPTMPRVPDTSKPVQEPSEREKNMVSMNRIVISLSTSMRVAL